jgi:Domain of unknown function (DUF4158)
MTAIDRTAYPRPGSRLTREELRARYTLTETDLIFIHLGARGEIGRLMLATMLKTRQDLGCFPATDEVHADTAAHLALQLGLTASVWPDAVHRTKSLYRYQAAVRSYLSVTPYGDVAEGLVTKAILETAETMSDPADLINQAIETLQASAIDLPAFSTFDRPGESAARGSSHAYLQPCARSCDSETPGDTGCPAGQAGKHHDDQLQPPEANARTGNPDDNQALDRAA